MRTDGEKMIWAAAFATARQEYERAPTLADLPAEARQSGVEEWATGEACRAVQAFRVAFRTRKDYPAEDEEKLSQGQRGTPRPPRACGGAAAGPHGRAWQDVPPWAP